MALALALLFGLVFGCLVARTLAWAWYAGGGWDKDGNRPGRVKWWKNAEDPAVAHRRASAFSRPQ